MDLKKMPNNKEGGTTFGTEIAYSSQDMISNAAV